MFIYELNEKSGGETFQKELASEENCVRRNEWFCTLNLNKQQSMSTLLDQFKSAVDMMHTGPVVTTAGPVAGFATTAQVPLVTTSNVMPQPVPQMANVSMIPVSTAVAPPAKSGNFLSKHWPVVVGVVIVLVSLVVVISLVIKNKTSGKRKKKGTEDDDDDDDMSTLNTRIHLRPQQQQSQIPRVPPMAPNIPITQDLRYTESPLRGAPLPINTRGAEATLQPTSGLSLPQPQASSQAQILPMPSPTITATGIPLQPTATLPTAVNPTVNATVAAVGNTVNSQDPNFTKL